MTETVRRSGRERTQTKVFVSGECSNFFETCSDALTASLVPPNKRKRDTATSSDDEREANDDEREESESSEEASAVSDDDDVELPDPRPRKTKTTTPKATPTSKRAAGPRKPRATPATSRKGKSKAFDSLAVVKDASISDDNTLFSACVLHATQVRALTQTRLFLRCPLEPRHCSRIHRARLCRLIQCHSQRRLRRTYQLYIPY